MDQHDEIVRVPLLIPQEQVLAVRGVDTAPVLRRCLDRRDRWMVVAVEGDSELRQPRADLVFLDQRRSSFSLPRSCGTTTLIDAAGPTLPAVSLHDTVSR